MDWSDRLMDAGRMKEGRKKLNLTLLNAKQF